MAKPYIKLDYDWREDPKVMLYEQKHKKAGLVDLITVFILVADCGGCLDTKDEGHMLKAQRALNKSRSGVIKTLEGMIECGLFKESLYRRLGAVQSDRSARDATARSNRRDHALAASKAAAEKRRAESAAGGNP